MSKVSMFDKIPQTSKVLFIGGGDGTSLKPLLEQLPLIQIDYVEASKEMILLAKKRIDGENSVKFIHSTIGNFLGKEYDVVITEFLFDLFEEQKINELIPMIALKLKEEGFWIDTDFRKTPYVTHKVLLRLMYFFFRLTANIKATELIETSVIFKANGFDLKSEKVFKFGFITSSLFDQR